MPKKRTELSDMDKRIIRLMAKHSLCLSAVADALHYHCNTVRYHVDVIRRDTGKDPSQFYDLVSLLHDLGELTEEKLVRHGRWEKKAAYHDGIFNTVACSVCKTYQPIGCWDYYDYCPNCGAKMDLEEEISNG
jgi:hypothetical protein